MIITPIRRGFTMEAVPTALPDEETTQIDDSVSGGTPIAVEDGDEPTRAWVRGWAVTQEASGQSTIRVIPPRSDETLRVRAPHVDETMRLRTTACEGIPEPIEEPLTVKYAALCRLIAEAELYGWNDVPTERRVRYDPAKRTFVRTAETIIKTRPGSYDGTIPSDELDVSWVDPTGVGVATGIRFAISRWPDFQGWFLDRLAERFRSMRPLLDAHREFYEHFAETLTHHRPSGDGAHMIIVITNS